MVLGTLTGQTGPTHSDDFGLFSGHAEGESAPKDIPLKRMAFWVPGESRVVCLMNAMAK